MVGAARKEERPVYEQGKEGLSRIDAPSLPFPPRKNGRVGMGV